MTVKELINLVARTRQAQKDYYLSKSPSALKKAITLEYQLDEAIKEVNTSITQSELSSQLSIFK